MMTRRQGAITAAALLFAAEALLLGVPVRAHAHPHGKPFLIGLAPPRDPAKVYRMMRPLRQYPEREVKYNDIDRDVHREAASRPGNPC